jgi:DNA polymerase-1
VIAQLENVKLFDTETTNIDANNAELVGLSFAITPHEAWYIPVPANYDSSRAGA